MTSPPNLLSFEEFSPAQLQAEPLGSPATEPPESEVKNHSFWTIEYYQKYFDVRTEEVVERIVSSIIPQRASSSYFDHTMQTKPDLYGPFWISWTLIFTIAISGNISNYLQHANANIHWQYDFHLVSYAATTIFCYTWLVPLALWGAIKWSTQKQGSLEMADEESPTPSMISLLCLYGYSLSIYIPVSILWTIQVSWLQWLLVITATVLSGFVLVHLLLPALKKSNLSLVLAGSIIVLHFLLAAGFMLYFFHVPTVVPTVSPTVPQVEVSSIKST